MSPVQSAPRAASFLKPCVANLPSGIHLRYFDSYSVRPVSFPPSSSWASSPPRLMVVAVHGVCFNSRSLISIFVLSSFLIEPICFLGSFSHPEIFSRLVRHVPEDVRFLAYNQRGYEGSSPAVFEASARAEAYTDDLSDFLRFIERKGSFAEVPKVVLGWSDFVLLYRVKADTLDRSKGTAIVVNLAARLSGFSSATSAPSPPPKIACFVLFEPPGSLLARIPTPDIVTSRGPPDASPIEAASHFARYCSLGDAVNSPPTTVAQDDVKGQATLDVAFEPGNLAHGFGWTVPAALATRTLAESSFPIGLLHGSRTNPYFKDAAQTIEKLWDEGRTTAGRRKAKLLEGGNHIAMVRVPAAFWQAVDEVVASLLGHGDI